MESVSLEQGENMAQIQASNLNTPHINYKSTEDNSETSISNELSNISQYFQTIPQTADPVGSSFFDAIPSPNDASSMMKSVTDIHALSELPENQANHSEAAPLIPENDFNAIVVQKPILAIDPHPIGPLFKETAITPPTLVDLFADENGGGDMEGKAFFDTIANNSETFLTTVDVQSIQTFRNTNNENISPFSDISTPISESVQEYFPYHDFWIPSKQTQSVLNTIASEPIGTFFPNKTQLTMPGIMIKDDMKDPVAKTLTDLDLHQDRQVLTADSVTQDANGIQHLIKEGFYHAAINITARLLIMNGQGLTSVGHPSKHTPFTLQLWLTRLALLSKLKHWEVAKKEAESFGDLDNPDMYYEFYDSYPGKEGSMAPFTLRCLTAELPHHLGQSKKTLTRLSSLLEIIVKILENIQLDKYPNLDNSMKKGALELWQLRECRVLYSLLNCSLAIKDFSLCFKLLDILLQKEPNHQVQLESAYGRLYVQLGDLHQAKQHFDKVSAIIHTDNPFEQVEELINNALISTSLDNYADAYALYQKAYSILPNNQALANNMGVCLLFMGKLKESMAFLENVALSQPPNSFHDGLLFNICTLYELESSHCLEKKKNLLSSLSNRVGDSFNISCLKFPRI